MATVRVVVSLPEELLAAIDRAAATQECNRSEFMREAARAYIDRGRPGVPADDWRILDAHEAMLILAGRMARRSGPLSIEAVRRWRDRRSLRRDGK